MLIILVPLSFILSQACICLSDLQNDLDNNRKKQPLGLSRYELLQLLISATTRSFRLVPKIWLLLIAPFRRVQTGLGDQSFFAFSPEDDKFSCKYINASRLNTCRNSVSGKDRELAVSIRAALGQVKPNSDEFLDMFSDYVQLCTCSNAHRKLNPKLCGRPWNTTFAARIQAWKQELQDTYRFHVMNSQMREMALPCAFPESQATSPTDSQSAIPIPPAYTDLFTPRGDSTSDLRTPNLRTQVWSFMKHTRSIDRSRDLRLDICTKLSNEEMGGGRIYIYRRPPFRQNTRSTDQNTEDHDLRHLKIGFTTQPTRTRLSQIKQSCGYEPEIVFDQKVTHAKRVENLIHAELEIAGMRRIESHCRFNREKCTKQHREWFEIEEDLAVRVCKFWCKWMNEKDPYNEKGALKCQSMVELYKKQPSGLAADLEPAATNNDEMHSSSQPISEQDLQCGSRKSPLIVKESDNVASTSPVFSRKRKSLNRDTVSTTCLPSATTSTPTGQPPKLQHTASAPATFRTERAKCRRISSAAFTAPLGAQQPVTPSCTQRRYLTDFFTPEKNRDFPLDPLPRLSSTDTSVSEVDCLPIVYPTSTSTTSRRMPSSSSPPSNIPNSNNSSSSRIFVDNERITVSRLMKDAEAGDYESWSGFDDSPTKSKLDDAPEVIIISDDDEPSEKYDFGLSSTARFRGRTAKTRR